MASVDYNFFAKKVIENKSLLFAIIFSALLHLLSLTIIIELPKSPRSNITLNIRLQQHSNFPAAIDTNHPIAKQAIEKSPPKHYIQKALKSPITNPQPSESAESANHQESAPVVEGILPVQANQISIEKTINESPFLTKPNNFPKSPFIQSAVTINSQAYKYIETEFEVTTSGKQGSASKNILKFRQIEGGNSYSLDSTDAISGVVSQSSEGLISSQGLKPNFYRKLDTNNPSNATTAIFAWGDGSIEVNGKYQKLAEKTHDELSYLYQFMFYPPAAVSGSEIAITTPLQNYVFKPLGEEVIQTSIGELKTIHLVSSQEMTVDIWLALDYQYTPVKIRSTAKDGRFSEQSVSRITTTPP